MAMTLQDAIYHCEDRAKADCSECAKEHRQLAEWLKELERLRWIPVEERLPDEPENGMTELEDLTEYIVRIFGAEKSTVLYYAGDGEWYRDGEFYDVVVWMQLPEPYQG